MRNCQRCTTGEVSWTNDTVCLTGEVYANLCPECQTEHSGIIKAHPLWVEAGKLRARAAYYDSLARAGKPATEAQFRELEDDMRATDLALREISLEFVKPLPVKAKSH